MKCFTSSLSSLHKKHFFYHFAESAALNVSLFLSLGYGLIIANSGYSILLISLGKLYF